MQTQTTPAFSSSVTPCVVTPDVCLQTRFVACDISPRLGKAFLERIRMERVDEDIDPYDLCGALV